MPLTTSVTEKMPGYYEIALAGRLDTETHGQVEKVAQDLLAKQPKGIRLDMARLSYISSMGLRVVLKIAKDIKAKKGVFAILNLQPQIKKVFDIAATLPPESIFASVAEADAYFDEMQRRALGQGGAGALEE
jgi:anti-sigma B factor antagonist